MKETDKFIVRICCKPKIKIVDDDGITSFAQKITTMRVEKVDEGIIAQLREIMRTKGITELFAIDESKILQLVKEHKALEIIKNNVDIFSFINAIAKNEEECELLKEVML